MPGQVRNCSAINDVSGDSKLISKQLLTQLTILLMGHRRQGFRKLIAFILDNSNQVRRITGLPRHDKYVLHDVSKVPMMSFVITML